MKKITKAVIAVAGYGTRFLPATKNQPKEMLPIIDKPVIHYVVQEAINAGIDDIIIITGRGKRAIEDYFDSNPELELHLQNTGKEGALKQMKHISSLADIHYIRQKEPLGLGHAILKAEKHIGNEPFAVLLGDDIIRKCKPAILQLMESFEKTNCSLIGVEEVPMERISKYGVVEVLETDPPEIKSIVEKPKMEDALSNLGVIGRYALTPEIFECLHKTGKGHGGEIQLTDALKLLLDKQKIYAKKIDGIRYDVGDKFNYVRATVDFALMREKLGASVKEYLSKLK